MTKVYESVPALTPPSRIIELQTTIGVWRDRANKQRDPKKARFCEGRVMLYKKQLEALNG